MSTLRSIHAKDVHKGDVVIMNPDAEKLVDAVLTENNTIRIRDLYGFEQIYKPEDRLLIVARHGMIGVKLTPPDAREQDWVSVLQLLPGDSVCTSGGSTFTIGRIERHTSGVVIWSLGDRASYAKDSYGEVFLIHRPKPRA